MAQQHSEREAEGGVVAQQVAERRRHVLSKTRELLEELGYEALTMRDLAVACGVAVPTLYRNFGGKQALVREAVQEHFGGAILGHASTSNALTGHARLLEILDACGADVRRLPGYYRQLMAVLVAEQKPEGEHDAPGVGMPINAGMLENILISLEQMRAAGQLQEWVDIELTAERIVSEAMISGMQWAMGMLSSRGYHATLVYTTCMMLLGASKGAAARAFRERIEQTPRSARFRGHKPGKKDSP